MFRRNVGGLDRVLRLSLGGILFLGGLVLLTGRTTLGVTFVVVGLLALITGIIRFCGLYIPFGISTSRPGERRLNQVCDCAAWMKERLDDRTAVNPPVSAKEEVGEAMTAARGR